jgi:acyl-CoA synthetase (AMP-forming)/AMP-acid ligase II
MNLFSLLEKSARRYPSKTAVFEGLTPRMTYHQLLRRALGLAGSLASSVMPGDRIAIVSENCPEYIEILFACWAKGAVAVPINAKLHAREVRQILGNAEAKLVFTSEKLGTELTSPADGPCEVVEIGAEEYALRVAHQQLPVPVPVAPVDLAWLFYTSGTTGRPKGAMLSHRNLMSMTMAHLADLETLEPDDAIIHAAPMSHGSGLYILPYIARGCRHVIPASRGFDAREFLDLCEAHRGCGAFMAPTMVRRLRIEAEKSETVFPGLRSIVYGGGPMYLEDIQRALRRFGAIFRQLYGQGEAPMTITGMRKGDFGTARDSVLSSVGWPRSGVDVRVVDETGAEQPVGIPGEIICRGDVVMAGYWRDPAATSATLRDGWLYTGDIGFVSEDGMLTLRDRSKEVIISGGSNIYPREVEEALLSHPSVAEVAVIGEPDPEWGEAVVAVVVPETGQEVDSEMLDACCLQKIARFKRPRRYVVVESLPKSSYGKILKRVLKEQLQNGRLGSRDNAFNEQGSQS